MLLQALKIDPIPEGLLVPGSATYVKFAIEFVNSINTADLKAVLNGWVS